MHSKEELSLDNSVKLTSNNCSLHNYTKIISYKSKYINYVDAKASNFQSKCYILDKLGFVTSSLQDDYLDTIRLKILMKDILCVFKDNNTQMNVESWSGRGNKSLSCNTSY